MKTRIGIAVALALGALALAGCTNRTEPHVASSSAELSQANLALADIGFSVANPIDQGNVRLIPIVSNKPVQPTQDVATLAVAKQNGWIEITESESADYNAVHVKNTGPKPILLIAGDLVLGGHQDRVVAHDTIVEPGKEMDVEVFCVEEGRSTGPTNVFEPSEQPVPHRVRREAIFAQDQESVWSSVDSYNASAAAAPATETVKAGLQTDKVVRHVRANADPIVKQLIEVPNVVGYVLVVDGKIDSAEVFGSSRLFRQAAPALVKSVLAQQATSITSPRSAMNGDEVAKFLVAALTGRRDEQRREIASNVNGMGRGTAPNGSSTSAGIPFTTNNYAVQGDHSVRGFELYENRKSEKPGGSALLHGTYSKGD